MVKICVSLNENLRKQLYDHVKAKYSGLRGGLSREIELAVTEHLSTNAHTNTHKLSDNSVIPRVHRTCQAIIDKLREKGLSYEVMRNDLFWAISIVAGSDNRTYRKWLSELKQHHYIKEASERANVFRILLPDEVEELKNETNF